MTENYKLFECVDVRIIKIFQFFLARNLKNGLNLLFYEADRFYPLDTTLIFKVLKIKYLYFFYAIFFYFFYLK